MIGLIGVGLVMFAFILAMCALSATAGDRERLRGSGLRCATRRARGRWLSSARVTRLLQFTHDDRDGIGAAVIATAKYGDGLEFRQCSTQQLNDAVAAYLDAPDGRPLLITDLSLNADVAPRVDAYAATAPVTLLDHHVTAQWLKSLPLGDRRPRCVRNVAHVPSPPAR